MAQAEKLKIKKKPNEVITVISYRVHVIYHKMVPLEKKRETYKLYNKFSLQTFSYDNERKIISIQAWGNMYSFYASG